MYLPLIVVAQGALPIQQQVKEQIKWLILQELLLPGASLPSVRELSQILGLNRNTINTVYDELRAEGLICMGRGRGAQVADSDRVRQLPRLKELSAVISQAFKQAEAKGFGPAEIARAAQLSAQLLLAWPAGAGTITFVECGEHESDFYVEQMGRMIHQPVQFLSLDEFRTDLTRIGDMVVTTIFHAAELRRLVPPDVSLVIVGAAPVVRLVVEIAQLPPGTRVAFICRGKAGGEWMKCTIAGEHVAHLHLDATGFQEPDAEAILQAADVIYASPSVYEEVLARIPDPKRVRRFDMTLTTMNTATPQGA